MKRIFTRTAFTVMFFALLSAALNSNAQTLASAEKLEKKATTDAVTTKADNKTVKSDSSATQTTDAKATTAKPADDNWKPTRRIWGYTFGDFYYKAHGDPLNRGGSNQYTGINQYRNGFQFRRIYLGYDYDINKKFSAELLLAAEDNFATNSINGSTASTSGDLLTDNKFSFYIKLMNIRIHDLWKGTDLVVGQVATPAFPMLTEKVWGYRDVERTVSDIRRTPS
ncbi:MAG TPA: hypothetical protein VHC47_07535, partial [Mucilaginibacter sp.]|nr:hypothetical protein [Mucilaginibacter sp.]